jgi:flagellar biosynthesis/type III secretory pathway M-ring protein FliF/YscJ
MYPHKTISAIILFLSDAIAVFGLWKSMTVPVIKPAMKTEVKKPEFEREVVEEKEELEEEEEEKVEEEKEEVTEEEKEEEKKEEAEEHEEEEKKPESPKEGEKKVKFLCPICKTEVDADATSCPNCGVTFEE